MDLVTFDVQCLRTLDHVCYNYISLFIIIIIIIIISIIIIIILIIRTQEECTIIIIIVRMEADTLND